MSSCTLYGILARDGRSVAVFRRGPSRAVLLLRWWLHSDTIEEGQWFRGRVHEHDCDLSPDGEYLVYFAAKHKGPFGTWTAISRPPFLTALALWPVGDTWNGGGIFLGPREVGLAHRATQMELAPGFALPKNWRVGQLPHPTFNFTVDYTPYIGSPLECIRLTRAEWEINPGKSHQQKRGSEVWLKFDPPLTFRRRQPGHANPILSSIITGRFVRNGPSDQRCAEISDQNGRVLRRFDVADWVEFSHGGDLLVATAGCLYRLPAHRVGLASDDPLEGAKLVADLRPLTFRQRVASSEARRW
jgi:hypothetical protein